VAVTSNERITWLKIGAAAAIGLLVMERLIVSPVARHWKEQGERILVVRERVQRGQLLLEREDSIRGRWAVMRRGDLPDDPSAAENEVLKAVARWARDSRVTLTGLTPQWREYEGGYRTLECRASATGSQSAIGRFLYELETDPMAIRLESCEIGTRDARGQQLTLNARFSGLQLAGMKEPGL
jgi:hypothetical protein